MKLTPSYWMLADTEVPLAWDASQLDSFASYFKHALLFNEKLMLSDAQAVNCMNFRRLLTKNEDFQQVLNKDFLSIAVRAPDDAPAGQSLTQVRDAFVREGKQRTENADEFHANDDLELINSKCEISLYNYTQLRDNYTNGVLRIMQLPHVVAQLGESDQREILDLLAHESEQNSGLGRIYLQKGLGHDLKNKGKEEIWGRHRDLLMKVSDAPYITGIPTVMAADPIYSPMHEEAFNLVSGGTASATAAAEVTSVLSIQTDLNLSSYQHALAQLKLEDVFYLRDTNEYKTYQKLSKKPVSSEAELNKVTEALVEYQRLIDHLIIRRKLGLKLGRLFKAHRQIQSMRKVSQEAGAYSLGLMLSGDALTGGALTMANFFVSSVLDKQVEREQRKMDAQRHLYAAKLEREHKTEKIGAERRFAERPETVYTSVIANPAG